MGFVPRASLVDLELDSLDAMKASPIGTMFKRDNCVFDTSGADNIETKQHHTKDAQLIDEVVDTIGQEAESRGLSTKIIFQITKSFAGGTNSRLRALLLMKVRVNYPGRIIAIFSVYPSPKCHM